MTYEEAIANLQYDMLLDEWRSCVKVLEAIADLLRDTIVEAKERNRRAFGANEESSYAWFVSVLQDILSGKQEVIRRKSQTYNHQLESEVGAYKHYLLKWRKAYADLEIENAGLKAQIEKLKELLPEVYWRLIIKEKLEKE